MSMGTLSTVAQQLGGQLIGEDRTFTAVSTDTRSLLPGDLFFALQGPRFDAADFLDQAQDKGAAGAVVNRRRELPLSQVQVPNTRRALGELAAAWRRGFDVPLAGITGSNGKTTVKEMIAAILRVAADGVAEDVLVTSGNLNNEIGLPITLLGLRPSHRFAVLEMGASHPGDIAELAAIAAPDVGVVTNVAPAHLEGFGSVEQVARTKSELLAALPEDGTAVVNRDDAFFDLMHASSGARRVVSFGLDQKADYFAEDIQVGNNPQQPSLAFHLCCPGGSSQVDMPMAGRHNVRNALAAAAVTMSMGAGLEDVRRGLGSMENVSGRLRAVNSTQGGLVFDDSYNANPGSVKAAIEFLASLAGERRLVLADMGELGEQSSRLHEGVGEWAREHQIDELICIGPMSKAAAGAYGSAAHWYPDVAAYLADDPRSPEKGVNVLVKGSRSMGMERVVERLVGKET